MHCLAFGIAVVAVAVATAACGAPADPTVPAEDAQEYEAHAIVLEKEGRGPQLCLGGIATSLPPQCGGPQVRNWDWAEVPRKETAGDTTWASVNVRGTYDGTDFTLTALPERLENPPPPPVTPEFRNVCATPEVVDPTVPAHTWEETDGFGDSDDVVATWISTDQSTINVLVRPGSAARIHERIRRTYKGSLCLAERDQRSRRELHAVQARVVERLGTGVLSASSNEIDGVVDVTLILATPELQAELDREFGPGVVKLEGRLRPVSRSRPPGAGAG